MLLGEPRRTQFDLNFSLFGFPIRVSPWFWLVALLLLPGTGGPEMLIWVAVVFLSILIHELGHAFAFRYFGIGARVVLYHFGGVAIPDSHGSAWSRPSSMGDPRQQVVISAAGPAAQLLAAFLVIVLVRATGYQVPDFFGLGRFLPLEGGMVLGRETQYFLGFFVGASVFWAVLNLFPVYPLDGGQIARQLFLLFGNQNAVLNSLLLSTVTGAGLAIYGFSHGQPFLGIMFGMLAYSSYQAYQAYRGPGGGIGRPW